MASYNAGSAAEFGNAHSNDSALDVNEKSDPTQLEAKEQERLDAIAARGHAATDQYGVLHTQTDSKGKTDLSGSSSGNALLTFDPKAEAKLRLKIDLYIIPTVALLYLFCFIDRANIGNARLAGLEKDLGLKGYDYNILLSCFYISYIRK